MKKLTLLPILCLTALLVFTLAACGEKETKPEDTTPATESAAAAPETEPATEPAAESATEPETEPETQAGTQAETVEETTEENQLPPDPYTTPVRVGTSYDGETPCYDGRFEHEWEVFKTVYGEFASIQDAVDSLEGEGGNISLSNSGDIGLCLSVNIPTDGCFYRLFYNFNNCDFVFNYGYTYDDGSAGYAYYSSLDRLDAISGLDGTHVYCWGAYDELEQGYYLMTAKTGEVAEGERHYIYELECPVEDVWPGLPWGEDYFD